jgi:CubicO group peptidase (beta-lactamase class C family)
LNDYLLAHWGLGWRSALPEESAIAQAEEAAESVDVVTLCGEAALNLTTELVTLPDDQAAKLDDLLRQVVTTAGTAAAGISPAPGLVLWVETPTGAYWRAVGVADVASCEPLQPTAPFQIGSNTKMMTALIIFQLQEAGVLSIDDPLSDWLPDDCQHACPTVTRSPSPNC